MKTECFLEVSQKTKIILAHGVVYEYSTIKYFYHENMRDFWDGEIIFNNHI